MESTKIRNRRLARAHAALLGRAATGELAAVIAAGRRAERLAAVARLTARRPATV